ncbi:MAG: hypothetical protein HYY45_01580 [Deltaproteobacteria bacterium]|nr:hypothetical protein [Deltaproteobacteria bacterium]
MKDDDLASVNELYGCRFCCPGPYMNLKVTAKYIGMLFFATSINPDAVKKSLFFAAEESSRGSFWLA